MPSAGNGEPEKKDGIAWPHTMYREMMGSFSVMYEYTAGLTLNLGANGSPSNCPRPLLVCVEKLGAALG